MAERVWTIQELLTWTTDFFRTRGMETPRLDAEVLLAAVLGRDRMYLYVHFDEPLEPAELATFRGYVKERGAHVPMAYILGRREFMGLSFRVTRDTLIPRPDTEILAQFATCLDGIGFHYAWITHSYRFASGSEYSHYWSHGSDG